MVKLKVILGKIVAVLGAALIMNGIFLAAVSNFNMGIVATLVFGAFLFGVGVLYQTIFNHLNKKIVWIFNIMTVAGTSFMLVTTLVIAIAGNTDTTTFDEDAVIVLGAGIRGESVTLPLMRRLDKAADYFDKNPEALIVVSGGQGPQEHISEALAMKRYLIRKNVPEESILMEDRSTNTYENFSFSKTILNTYFNGDYTTAYITNSFHVYRAGRIAKMTGLNSGSYAAETEWYLLPSSYLRELLAVVKFWLIKATSG